MVMTTRSTLLSRATGFTRVPIGCLDLTNEDNSDWLIAEDLFDTLLGAAPETRLTDSYKRDRKTALKSSCGLALAIKTFVGVVHIYMENPTVDGIGSVLARIESRTIGLTDEFVGADLNDTIGHPGLFAAMEESLSFLDTHQSLRVMSMPLAERKSTTGDDGRFFGASYDYFSGRPLNSRYAALEAMPGSSARLSFHILCRLWHLKNVEEVENIALLFANIGLGQIEEGEERVFSLHGLQFEFCVRSCGKSSGAMAGAVIGDARGSLGVVNGHALFLSSCESPLCSEKKIGENGDVEWVTFCFGRSPVFSEPALRQYLARNLFRHLRAAAATGPDGVKRTIMSVLADFCWLRGRVIGDGLHSAILDCANALASRSCVSASSSAETRLLTGGPEKSIRALQHSLMLVGDGVSVESDGTLAGSLIQLSKSSGCSGDAGLDAAFLRKLACSSEVDVRGAWVKPIHGCSRAQGQGVLAQAVVGNGGWVRSLAGLGDGSHFVSGSADGAVRVHESEYLGAVLEMSGHVDQVNCVDVARMDGEEMSFLLFSCSHDGSVRSCEVKHDLAKGFVEKKRAIVGECGSRVWCLSVSNGGDIVAAGCESGHVFIWKRQDGDAVLRFGLVTSFRCSESEGESGWVRGVAVSRSGEFVLAGEQKGGICFWDSGAAGREATVYRCCAYESDADLLHVLLSEDESSVSFVFDEPAGCEVWDVASRRKRAPRVFLSNFRNLICATFSNGEHICVEESGSRDVRQVQ